MGTRQGTLLEDNISKIFELAGFKVSHQKKINSYEIDVFAEYSGYSVAVECKQYEKSEINVRNLIHQWDSKNKEIKVSKILLAFYGVDIQKSDLLLAEKYNIKIWDEEDISNYLNLLIDNREKGKKLLLKNIEFLKKGFFERIFK